jgi:hypothetical protein
MGFHKRRITDKLVRYCYINGGIDSLKGLLTADAFICEQGLASTFIDMSNAELVCWLRIEKTIYDDIYTKGTCMLTEAQQENVAVILADNTYSRDEKLIKLKQYLSQFKDELGAYGIEYTYLASQILKEHHEKLNRSRDII